MAVTIQYDFKTASFLDSDEWLARIARKEAA